MSFYDTITAVSTPPGKGGLALIRVSGRDAFAVADRVFLPRGGDRLSRKRTRTAVWGGIHAPSPDGGWACVDDGIAVLFSAPRSFTGEDVAEITCHGGVLVTQTVLAATCAAGARLATAGEFTRRAFVNGKLGLAAAEALSQLLDAQTHEQLLLARGGLDGVLTEEVRRVYEDLVAVAAALYASIDFPDEDLGEQNAEDLAAGIGAALHRVGELANTYRTGRAVTEGIRTVICGRTNAGKSTLYNRLIGREAAIVTAHEGTTRDLLEETVALGGVTLRLCDTAGLRQPVHEVEVIGISRSRREIKAAELVLALFDGSRPPGSEDQQLLALLERHPGTVLALLTKADLPQVADVGPLVRAALGDTLTISATSGTGMEALAETVRSRFLDEGIDVRHDPVAANARQYGALMRSAQALERTLEAFASGLSAELCCSELEVALEALGEIDGRQVSEDVVTQIFSRFCIGK